MRKKLSGELDRLLPSSLEESSASKVEKKVQAEVRHAELENLRLVDRILHGEREDPDIDKKVIIEGAVGPTVPIDDPE